CRRFHTIRLSPVANQRKIDWPSAQGGRFDSQRPSSSGPLSRPRPATIEGSKRIPLRIGFLKFRDVQPSLRKKESPIVGNSRRAVLHFLRRNRLEANKVALRVEFQIDHSR